MAYVTPAPKVGTPKETAGTPVVRYNVLPTGNAVAPYAHDTDDGFPAIVVITPEAAVIADPLTVAVTDVAVPAAWLLGVKVVDAVANVAPEAVNACPGDTVAGWAGTNVVIEKVIGTPGWLVLSVATAVYGALPAMKFPTAGVTPVIAVPAARSYATHVGPGYDAGEEPPSIRVVVNVPVGGGAVAGESVLAVTVPRVMVSENPGARLPVKVSAPTVATGSNVK